MKRMFFINQKLLPCAMEERKQACLYFGGAELKCFDGYGVLAGCLGLLGREFRGYGIVQNFWCVL